MRNPFTAKNTDTKVYTSTKRQYNYTWFIPRLPSRVNSCNGYVLLYDRSLSYSLKKMPKFNIKVLSKGHFPAVCNIPNCWKLWLRTFQSLNFRVWNQISYDNRIQTNPNEYCIDHIASSWVNSLNTDGKCRQQVKLFQLQIFRSKVAIAIFGLSIRNWLLIQMSTN